MLRGWKIATGIVTVLLAILIFPILWFTRHHYLAFGIAFAIIWPILTLGVVFTALWVPPGHRDPAYGDEDADAND